MMYSVTLTNDVRPWRAGDTVHVPEGAADALINSGDGKDKRPFRPDGQVYEDRTMTAGDGRKGYKTKGAQA